MKITQFILTLGFGGAEAVVRDYALELQKRGHQITVVVLLPFLHNDNEKKLLNNGIKIRSIYEEIFLLKKQNLFLRVIRKPFRTLKVRKWLKSYFKAETPHVFHIHLGLLNFIPVGLCSKYNTKLFFTCHNEASYYFGNPRTIEFKAAKQLIKNDNMQMFALHSRMKRELNSIFDINTTEVINNPFDLSRFCNINSSAKAIKKSLGFSEDDFIVGHVGRFMEQKNHDFLIGVFNALLKEKPNAKLLLVGDGPLKNNIENKSLALGIHDKICFTGLRSDVPDLLSIMDVFLFPSKFEGVSIAFLEAQSRCEFLVASKNVSVDSAVTDKVCFIGLDEPLDVWVNAIINPSQYLYKAENKLEDFDIKNVINRLECFYAR